MCTNYCDQPPALRGRSLRSQVLHADAFHKPFAGGAFCHCKVLLSNRAGEARDADYQEVIGWCLIFADASFGRSTLKGDV
jgi:hypothetical protein